LVGKQTNQFQKIEQPVSLKMALALVLGGLSFIGAELW
jgi:plastocyanin domain-containing protein